MRAIIQRVTKASVTVGDELISSIGRGLCVLIGISRDDSPKEREVLARKILNLRLFDDDSDKRWAQSVKDKELEILCVSQFTLYSVLKGNKPDFHQAMGGDQSQIFYHEFLDLLRKDYNPDKIKDGQFGAHMQVNIQNDGPVTIQLDYPPETGNSSLQDAAPSKDVLRQARQELIIVKRKESDNTEFRKSPSHHAVEVKTESPINRVQTVSTKGYLVCTVCSSGHVSVEESHLTTTMCSSCCQGLHADCTAFHKCGSRRTTDDNSATMEQKSLQVQRHIDEGPDVTGIVVHAPTRMCIECHVGDAKDLCNGCNQNLHENCKLVHDCPVAPAPRIILPSLSQVLQRKYSKYGRGDKHIQASQTQSNEILADGIQSRRPPRLERHKTKKDCCVCSRRWNGVRRRSQTLCFYCKRGLHWDCRLKHECQMLSKEQPPVSVSSNIVNLGGGRRRRRDCCVCSSRKLGRRHRVRTICRFCKKGLHHECEQFHDCPWIGNRDGAATSIDGENHNFTDIQENAMEDGADMNARSDFDNMCRDMKQQAASIRLSPRSLSNSTTSGASPFQSGHQVGQEIRGTSQQQVLSRLHLQPTVKPPASKQIKLQYSGSSPSAQLVLHINTGVDTIRNSYMDEAGSTQDQKDNDLDASQDIASGNVSVNSSELPIVEKISVTEVRDGRKECIVCSNRATGERKRAYTQCSVCKRGLHTRCLQFHDCSTEVQPKLDIPSGSPGEDGWEPVAWTQKDPVEMDTQPTNYEVYVDGASPGDPLTMPKLMHCEAHNFYECCECRFFEGVKKQSSLKCSECGNGVHKKCLFRHECDRTQNKSAVALQTPQKEQSPVLQSSGTFVGELPSVMPVSTSRGERGDLRKNCEVCTERTGDGKRFRSRTQCTICKKGLHVRCLSQHICPGSEFASPQRMKSPGGNAGGGVSDLPNDHTPLKPAVESISMRRRITHTNPVVTLQNSPLRDRRQKDSKLIKTGHEKLCCECTSHARTRMACPLCLQGVHFGCEWQHPCNHDDAKDENSDDQMEISEPFADDVVPIDSSEIKTRKRDCVVCSNRREGRRSRSTTKCNRCERGLHRICAPKHICPVPRMTEPNPVVISDEEEEESLGYVHLPSGGVRYCCVCSTSRKSHMTRTICSSCERGLHPQCVQLHNCHSLVPRVQNPVYEEPAGQREVDASDDDEDDVEMVDPEPQLVAERRYEDVTEDVTGDASEQAIDNCVDPQVSNESFVVESTGECEVETGGSSERGANDLEERSSSNEGYVETTEEFEIREINEPTEGSPPNERFVESTDGYETGVVDNPGEGSSPNEGLIESAEGFETAVSSFREVGDPGEGSSEDVVGQLEVIVGECQEVSIETEKDLSNDASSEVMEEIVDSPDPPTPADEQNLEPRVEVEPQNFEIVSVETEPQVQMDILAEAFQEGAEPGDIVEYLIATCEEVISNGPYEGEEDRLGEHEVVGSVSRPFVPQQMEGHQMCSSNGGGITNTGVTHGGEEHAEDMEILVSQLMATDQP